MARQPQPIELTPYPGANVSQRASYGLSRPERSGMTLPEVSGSGWASLTTATASASWRKCEPPEYTPRMSAWASHGLRGLL